MCALQKAGCRILSPPQRCPSSASRAETFTPSSAALCGRQGRAAAAITTLQDSMRVESERPAVAGEEWEERNGSVWVLGKFVRCARMQVSSQPERLAKKIGR